MSKNNRKKAPGKLPVRDAALEAPSGKFWTLRLEPMEFYVVADNSDVPDGDQNLGTGIVEVYAGMAITKIWRQTSFA
jgi:hypothetical protein